MLTSLSLCTRNSADFILQEVVLNIEKNVGIALSQVLRPRHVELRTSAAERLRPADLHQSFLVVSRVGRNDENVTTLRDRHDCKKSL